MSNEFVARKGFQSLRSSSFEETVRVSGSIYSPAEAFLTASWASHSISSSYANTSSWSINSITSSYFTGSTAIIGSLTASYVNASVISASTLYTDLFKATMVTMSVDYLTVKEVINGTASWAINAASASYVRGQNVDVWAVSKTGTYAGGLLVSDHFIASTIALIDTFGTSVNGTSAAVTTAAGDIGHPGVVQLTTGTNAAGRASLLTSANGIRFGDGTYTMEAMILLPTTSTSTQRFTIYVGFGDNSGAGDQVDGAYFQYTDATSNNWQIKTSSNSTRTTTTTSTGVVGNTWTKLKVVVADVQMAYFYVNDVLVGSINNNVPQGSGRETGIIFKIDKSVGTTARTLQLDYVKVSYT